MGQYGQALKDYERIRAKRRSGGCGGDNSNDISLNVSVCMFYLGLYEESQKVLEEVPNGTLKARLLFHLMHKLNKEQDLLELHGTLRDVVEDQLSLAGMHYLRAHYQEAIDIYKRILLDNK